MTDSQSQPSQAFLPTSTYAVISICCAIIGLFLLPLLGSILGVIFGILAIKETRANPPTKSGDALAIVGIVVGVIGFILWCIMGILGILGFIVPSLCCCGFYSEFLRGLSTFNNY